MSDQEKEVEGLSEEEIAIRKKEKRIDKNHWMSKLQKYTFNIDAHKFYMGYCPFFWMSWLALLCVPFVFIWKTFMDFIFRPINKKLDDFSEERAKVKEVKLEELEKVPLIPCDQMLVDFHEWYENHTHEELLKSILVNDGNYFKKLYECFYFNFRNRIRLKLWFEANPDWRETHYPQAVENVKKLKEAREKYQEKKRLREVRLNKLACKASTVGSLLVKILIPVLALGVIYGLYLLTMLAIANATMDHVIGVLIVLGMILVVTLGIFFCKLFFSWLSSVLSNRECKEKKEKLVRTKKVFKVIKTAVSFVVETIKFTYKRECPMIIWGEETGKIEKRNKETK